LVPEDSIKLLNISAQVSDFTGVCSTGLRNYYRTKVEELEIQCRDKQQNLRRLEAQRNEYNTKGPALYVYLLMRCIMECATCRTPAELPSSLPSPAVRMLREELQLLQEPGSYVGEVIKLMSKTKVLVKVHPEGKYVVDLDKASPRSIYVLLYIALGSYFTRLHVIKTARLGSGTAVRHVTLCNTPGMLFQWQYCAWHRISMLQRSQLVPGWR
jgi:hypothetical protein